LVRIPRWAASVCSMTWRRNSRSCFMSTAWGGGAFENFPGFTSATPR
jgi:hypothetical protein